MGDMSASPSSELHVVSIADEIVCTHQTAEIGPAAGAPVIDKAVVTHQGFESLGFAQWRGSLAPRRLYRDEISFLGGVLGIFEHAFRRAGVSVDETKLANQCGEFL